MAAEGRPVDASACWRASVDPKTVPGPNNPLRDVATGRFAANPATTGTAVEASIRGNSRSSQALTHLYRLEDLDGNLLKWAS